MLQELFLLIGLIGFCLSRQKAYLIGCWVAVGLLFSGYWPLSFVALLIGALVQGWCEGDYEEGVHSVRPKAVPKPVAVKIYQPVIAEAIGYRSGLLVRQLFRTKNIVCLTLAGVLAAGSFWLVTNPVVKLGNGLKPGEYYQLEYYSWGAS